MRKVQAGVKKAAVTSALVETDTLVYGVEVKGIRHLSFVLRPPKLADTYLATSVTVIPDDMGSNEKGKVFTPEQLRNQLAYQAAIVDAMLLAQIVELGDLDPVPSLEVLVDAVHPDDMEILRAAAETLKKRCLPSSSNLPTSAKSKSDSSEPVSD